MAVTKAGARAFINFVDRENLHSFFWRLRSLEDHALRGNEFAVPGMQSDGQGLAVVVEHIARAVGGTKGQLYEIFRELWTDAWVVALLKRNGVAYLVLQKNSGQWLESISAADRDSAKGERGGAHRRGSGSYAMHSRGCPW
jgi:hypothetical protein